MAFTLSLRLASALSLLFASAFAAPLAPRCKSLIDLPFNGSHVDTSEAIPTDVYNNLAFFEQFAAAAYCPSNSDGSTTGAKLKCSAGNCPLVEADDVTTVYEFAK